MNRQELEARTKRFAVSIVRLTADIPRDRVNDVLCRQLIRAGTSIGANYREANRASSQNDFAHRISIVERETAETQYWLELLRDAGVLDGKVLEHVLIEVGELLAIFTSVGKTLKSNRQSGLVSDLYPEYCYE